MSEPFELRIMRYVEPRLKSTSDGWSLALYDVGDGTHVEGGAILDLIHNPYSGFYEIHLARDEMETDAPITKTSNGFYAARPYVEGAMFEEVQKKIAKFYQRGTTFDLTAAETPEDLDLKGLI